MKTNFKIAFIAFIFFAKFTSHSQDIQMHAFSVDKKSRDWHLNLKDSVKTVRFFYTKFQDGLNALDLNRVAFNNDVRNDFYFSFNELGNITGSKFSTKDSLHLIPQDYDRYTYYNSDIKIKDYNIAKKRPQIYPAYYFNLIKLDHYRVDAAIGNSKDDISYVFFRYKYLNGKILEGREYHPKLKSSFQKFAEAESDLFVKYVYNYDDRGNLSKQFLYPGDYGRQIGVYSLLETETGFCEDTHLSYKYDSSDRLTKIELISCEELISVEEYVYHPTKNYITTLKRFIANSILSSYPTNDMIAQYNEYGDITEMRFIPKRETVPPKLKIGQEPVVRFYDYDYDKHNNWIRCRMYLMGKKDEPTVIAERIIEYYRE